MENIGRFAHLGGKDGVFSFEHLEFLMPTKIPGRNVQQAIVYRSPNLGRKIWVADMG